MARYIDLEILERRIKKYVKPEIPEEKAFVEWCKDECIRQAYAMPTADVVPKSEYDAVVSAVDNSTKEFLKLHDAYQEAKREVDRLKYNLKAVLEEIPETKAEVARGIFEEIENRAIGFGACFVEMTRTTFDEIKKKYTGEET